MNFKSEVQFLLDGFEMILYLFFFSQDQARRKLQGDNNHLYYDNNNNNNTNNNDDDDDDDNNNNNNNKKMINHIWGIVGDLFCPPKRVKQFGSFPIAIYRWFMIGLAGVWHKSGQTDDQMFCFWWNTLPHTNSQSQWKLMVARWFISFLCFGFLAYF